MKFFVLFDAIVALFNRVKCEPVLESDLSRFCYHAAIVLGEKNDSMIAGERDKTCSGAIISSTRIVTSFDCLGYVKLVYKYEYPSNITVRVGSADRLNGGITGNVREFKRLHLSDSHLDLAVITLYDPLPLGPNICTIRLANKKDDDAYIKNGSTIEACGYRMYEDGGVRQIQWTISPITDIDKKCPIFHFEYKFIYMKGGKTFFARKKDIITQLRA